MLIDPRRTMPVQDTEQVILDAARKVFVELGPVNARMQDVADEADITPSLLNYYFRTRKQLYRAVFEEELRRFVPPQIDELASERPLEEKLRDFSRQVIDFHADNPHLAAFVAFETHYNDDHRERLDTVFSGMDLTVLQQQLDARAEAKNEPAVDARHLLADILSLCLLPFVAMPIFKSMLSIEDEQYTAFLEERKTKVPELVSRALRTNGEREVERQEERQEGRY